MRRLIFPLIAMAVCLVGCGDSSEVIVVSAVDTEIPEQFTDQGVAWQSAAVTDKDNDCLSRFFRSHPDLAGSPELQGPPVLFRSGEKDVRFYWLSASVDGVTWSRVAYESGKYSTSDGEGSPFTD